MSLRFHEKSEKATTTYVIQSALARRAARQLLQVFKVNKVIRLPVKKARIP
jgi:hypothetical protein